MLRRSRRVQFFFKYVECVNQQQWLNNANPARGHNEARRSTCHIMVTTRYYSDKQGSKSREVIVRRYVYLGIGAWNGIGTGIVGTIGYVVLPTGVSTDVSRDIVWRPDKGRTTTTFQLVTETIWSWELSPNPGCSHTNWDSNSYNAQHVESD